MVIAYWLFGASPLHDGIDTGILGVTLGLLLHGAERVLTQFDNYYERNSKERSRNAYAQRLRHQAINQQDRKMR